VYGFDPLCGWCFGLVPAMETLASARPDLEIEVALGGLVVGARVGPYAAKADYIREASARLEAVTGRRPSEAFFRRVLGAPDVVASSVPPSRAIQQARERAPDRALAFAHAVQEAHFRDGRDLNDPGLYDELAARSGIPPGFDVPPPDAMPEPLASEIARTRSLGIASFPTLLAETDGALLRLPHAYRPDELLAVVAAALPPA
jgi:putative protein-disulfide isomerase